MQQFYALDPTSQRTEIPKLSHLLPVKMIFHNKCKICFLFAKNLFFPPIAPEAIYFRSRLAKKRHNYGWKEVSSSHAVKLKDKHIQEKEEDQETSSSAKRVTQVKSAVGHKASTVIWEVNFNQIFPEFGLNMSFIWAPNWGLSRRTNTANFSVVCVRAPFTSCAPSETLPVVCACVAAHVFSARDVCLL